MCTKAPKEIPEVDGMIFAHNAFRLDLANLEAALAKLQNETQWHWDNLDLWWTTFAPSVHHHHEMEERIFFPWVQSKVALPEGIADAHPELMAKLEEMGTLVKNLKQAKPEERLALKEQFAAAVTQFGTDLEGHFRQEEDLIPPLVRTNFSFKEYDKCIDKIKKDGGIKQAKLTLPWFVRAMTPEQKIEFFAELPLPLRILLKKSWIPAYHKHHVMLIQSIIDS